MKIIKSFYSKEDQKFHIILKEGNKQSEKTTKSFEKFAKFLNNDLSKSELYDFDFEGVNLRDYFFDAERINCKVLAKQDLLNETFYYSNIRKNTDLLSNKFSLLPMISEKRELTIQNRDSNFKNNEYCINYISDIHLDHKIRAKFPKYAAKKEISDYIIEIVRRLKIRYSRTLSSFLLIGGDVSFDFEISKMFYSAISKSFKDSYVITLIGNHELWDLNILNSKAVIKENIVDAMTEKYRKMLKELNINFLQNDLLIGKQSNEGSYKKIDFEIISENELLEISDTELNEKCLRSVITIFGGLGFSGYNTEFNAETGLYRNAVSNLEGDLRQTLKFEFLYSKLKRVLNDRTVIIFSHTQKTNWSKDDYQSNWIYVSGHTHQNYFYQGKDKTIYSDNQIGYDNPTIGLKHFYLSRNYDTLKDYSDGIHTISVRQYLDYYKGYNIQANYNKEGTIIHFLKRKGIYCFIQESLKSGIKSLLNGGQLIKLTVSQDLNYFYENLEYYSLAVSHILSDYDDKLRKLSSRVMKFGGTGNIHGCFVDIDFYNHLYLNPLDGKVIPYFAYSMEDKYVYKNIISLLYYKRLDLLSKYEKILKSDIINNQLTATDDEFVVLEYQQFAPETDIYLLSGIIKNFQYLLKMKVVRSWNEGIFTNSNDTEKSHILFNDLIELRK